MVLNSATFLLFLSGVCVVSYIFPRKYRYIWLLVSSYAFYLYDPVDFTKKIPAALLLLGATFLSYFCALVIQYSKKINVRKIFFLLALVVSIGVLLVLKYTNFFLGEITAAASLLGQDIALPKLDILLPLGLSYYTLQSVSYTFDVYTKKTHAEKNFFHFALYMSFFPGIVTGPINRAGDMLPQYKKPALFSYQHVSGGLFRVLWGFCKKMIVADTIHLYTSSVFSGTSAKTSTDLVIAGLLFSYQLYADFSGSCDIAIGSAKMLGFTFMENFNNPFSAKTFADLWRRWHISLTSFFRDYLYIPLGGSRTGRYRTILNTFIVFLISGLWHGASMGYVIWGFMNGVILVGGKLIAKRKNKLAESIPVYRSKLVRGVMQRIFVYLLFSICMLFFAASLFNTPVLSLFSGLFAGNFIPSSLFFKELAKLGIETQQVITVLVGIFVVQLFEALAVSSKTTIADWIRKCPFYVRWPLYYGLLFALFAFGVFGKSPFIYQQY